MTKSLKTVLLILIVLILVGVYILYYSSRIASPPSSSEVNTGLTDTEKENIAQIINQQLTNVPPLTTKQKEDIATKMMKSLSK